MANYSISDLAELTGIKAHTLRMWEKRYGLLSPQRSNSNIRYYEDDDLKMLKLIQRLTAHGIRISRIAEMSPEEMEAECTQIIPCHDGDHERLHAALLDMDVTRMDEVLDASILTHGFENTLLKLINPFLAKMELMWLRGKIEEANEACFRELIRRKTIREIDLMPHNEGGTRVLMFLPRGNQQEISHLFLHYFLRRHGLSVTDMGCDINTDCAGSAVKKCAFDCIIVVNADPVHFQFGSFIRDLASKTSLPIIIAGRASGEDAYHGNEQVVVLDTPEEIIGFANKLPKNFQIFKS